MKCKLGLALVLVALVYGIAFAAPSKNNLISVGFNGTQADVLYEGMTSVPAACEGTITANGTTAVVTASTCAVTGSRIIISRTSAPSGTAVCWTDTIVTGTSFNLDCSGAETGTFAYVILRD